MNKKLILSGLLITTTVVAIAAVTLWYVLADPGLGGQDHSGDISYRYAEQSDPSDVHIADHEQDAGPEPPQGSVTIVNVDAETSAPVKNVEYIVKHADTRERLEVIRTNDVGKASTRQLEFGTALLILQQSAPIPYSLDEEVLQLTIREEEHEITRASRHLDYVKGFEPQEDGSLLVTHLELYMETLMQNPELPNGCEITALTAVLNAYGYDVSKTDMADQYLAQEPYVWRDGKLFGADPYKAYAGNPRHERGAFFTYAPPIVEAANKYIADAGGTHYAVDISGSSREEIIEQLYDGVPVVIWVTLNLEKPRLNYSWYFHETEEFFQAPVNLHAVVLHGFQGEDVYVMDPLRGLITRNADEFFQSYVDLGSHAMVVTERAEADTYNEA